MPIIDPYGSKPKPFSNKGWFCGSCGAWVPDGVLHQCAQSKWGTPPDAMNNIIQALVAKVKELEVRIELLEDLLKEQDK